MSSAITLKSFARIIILTFVFSLFAPLLEILPVLAAPVAPKSNHLPQISIPVPGGVKVNTWNGNLFLPLQLLNIPGRGIPIDLSLSYNSTWFQTESNYGFGWQFSYNIAYEVKSNGDIVVVWHDGRSQKFVKDGSNFVAPVDTHDSFSQYESGKYKLVTKEGTSYFFENSGHKKITKITDTNGNPISFQYNSDQLVSKIIDSANREVTLAYTDKKLTKITDPNTTPAREVNITYDTNKNLTRVTDPLGYAINFEYDTNHFLTKIKDKKDSVTTLSYANGVVANVANDSGTSVYFGFDKKDYITSVIQTGDYNKHLVSRYDYDAEGRISKFYKVKDGNGNTNVQEFTWDANNNLTSFKDELGRVTSYTYDSKGNILSVVTPTGTSVYTYDPVYSRLTSEKDPNNNTTTYEYDAKGNLIKTIDAKTKETIYTYAANGDLLTEKNAKQHTTTFGYSLQGYQTTVTNPLTHTTTSTYDNAGRLLTATDPNNNTISFQYDINGNKVKTTDATGKFETYTYDKNGNMTSKTDANENTTTYEYDKLDRLIREVDAETNATLYVYNKLGLLEKLIDPKGNTTEYQYDWLGQLVKETDPEGKITWHEYDAVGNKNKTTNPNGQNIYYTYDDSNRLKFVDYSDNTKDTTYTYDAAGNTLTESNATVVVTRTYNELNQVTSVQTQTNGMTKIVAYMYDDVGNRSQMLDPDGGETFYSYDAANRLTQLQDPSNQITKYTYDNGGRTTKKELGNSSYTDYAYDNLNRLTTLTNKKSDGTVISSFSYTYDFSVNRSSMTANGQTTSYTYDKAYRLTETDYPGTAFENFTYDPAGNRLTKVDQNGTTTYTYDKANKLKFEGATEFTYDSNGNQTNSRGKTFEYDVQDSLKKVTLSDASTNEYTYYPDGRRLSMKNKNGAVTYYFYDGVNDLVETNSSGATQTRYTTAGVDGWLNMKQGSTQSYYLTDGLGSTTTLLDSSQETANTYSYDAFGKVTNQSGSVNNSFTYTGRRTDWDTNQYHYRARYYDPVAGRFTQKDPAGYSGGQNLYAYVLNNPIILVDNGGNHPAFVALFAVGAAWGLTEQLIEDLDDGQYEFEAYVGSAWGGGTKIVLTGLVAMVNPAMIHGSIPAINAAGELSGNYIYQTVRLANGQQSERDIYQQRQSAIAGFKEGLIEMAVGRIGKYIPGVNRIGKKTSEVVEGLYTKIHRQSIKNLGHRGMSRIYRNEAYDKLKNYLPESFINYIEESITQVFGTSYAPDGSTSGDYAELALNEKHEPVIIAQVLGQTTVIPVSGGSNSGGQWKVDWYVDKNMNHHMGTTALSTDNIDLNWGNGSPGSPSPAGADHFAARFEKDVYFDKSMKYEFKVRADDGYRLYIDNQLIEDKWWNGNHESRPDKDISAGYHRIRLDYYEDTGNAHVGLNWYLDPETYGGVWLCNVTTGSIGDAPNNCWVFTADHPELGDTPVGNDTVKSIHIIGEWEAALFRNHKYNTPGRNEFDMQHFTGSVADLGSGGHNKIGQNEASSIRVLNKKDARVRLYDLGDFNGQEFRTSGNIEYLRDFKFDDTAESIRVSPGYQAVVCTNIGMGGECGRTTGENRDIRELRQELRQSNNQGTASSLKICQGTCPATPMAPQNVIPSNEAQFATGNSITFQWFGNATGYSIEIWGGALSQKIDHWVGEATFYTRTDLQPSANPYYWKIKSWNDWGDSGHSGAWSFKLNHLPVQDISMSGPSEGIIGTDYSISGQIVPSTATTPVTYIWSPTPKSGQNTTNAIFNFDTPGEKAIKLTTINPAGTFEKTHTINISCLPGQYSAQYFNDSGLIDKSTSACTDTISEEWNNGGPRSTGNIEYLTGNGQHGALVISSNTVDAPIDAVATRGSDDYSLSATNNGFAPNQKILIHQTQGQSGVGTYQINEIQSYTTGLITLKNPLNAHYKTDTANKAQVIVIKEYTDVTVNAGATWSAKPWNGSTGGILIFFARGETTINGSIVATGAGFRGGSNPGGNQNGSVGEGSIRGSYQVGGITNNGSGGGAAAAAQKSSGGGGGHGTSGGIGIYEITQAPGGSMVGNSELSQLNFGGGGGSGSDSNPSSTSSGGGVGGGVIFISSSELVANPGSSIKSNGTNSWGSGYWPGGGGAGGSIFMRYDTADLAHTSIVSAGGIGTNGYRNGGTGSVGRIATQYCSTVSGAGSPEINATKIDCIRDNFSARYTKTQEFTEGVYNITLESDDGVRVWIGEQLVVDEWNNGYKEINVNPTIPSGTHEIKVEYFEDQGSAMLNFNIQPGSNQAPVISTIPDQIVGVAQTFTNFDLDNYVTDESAVTWTITGNTNLQVSKDTENIVTVTKPVNWIGEETLTFKAKDQWNATSTKTALFKVDECGLGQFKAQFYDNETLSGIANSGGCTDNITYNWEASGPNELTSIEHGNGSAGDVTVPVGQTVYADAVRVNATNYINENVTNITVASTTGFTVGDKILILQMQGTNAGMYEFNYIAAIDGNIITLTTPTSAAYTVSPSTYWKVQILKVNQYKNLTIDGTLSVNAWNGTTGGIMAFNVSEKLTVNGTIDVSGKGYRGGAGHNTNNFANPGESYIGQLTNYQFNHYNSGGGGGQRLEGGNGGGGGAGYNAGSFAVGSMPGYGGQPIANVGMNKLVMGGAGGGGGRAYSNPGGTGGNGGGVIYINANNVEINGIIKSHGTNGGNGTFAAGAPENRHGHSGGGGGGAGGMVVIKGSIVNIGTNKITLARGNAGAISGGSWSEGHGSVGSGKIEYCRSIAGTASAAQIVQQATCEQRVDRFSARWTGSTNIVEDGQYQINVNSDDGVKIWIDNNLVVDKWTGGIQQDSPIVDLTAGFHSIKVEYFEQIGAAGISLDITKQEPQGPETGIFTGEYFNNKELSGDPVFTNTTPVIDYGWGGSPFPGVNADNFSARWTGYFDFTEGGHTFTAGGDDGIRVFVDDIPVVNAWVDQGYTEYQGVANLTAGVHKIVFEFYEAGGGANASLYWEAGNTIPVDAPCTTNNNEYCATYFNNQTLSGTPVLSRQEFADLDRDWGQSSPGLNVVSNDFTGRWEGKFEFEAGNYIFEHQADDGIRAWIDNELFVDRWNGQSYNEIETTKLMTAGLHDIKVEFLEWGGNATVEFEWTFAGAPVNNAPVVTQVPGQTINQGQSFTTLNLTNYVSDPDIGDAVTWSHSGNTNLSVNISNNIATITAPSNFAGTENITFTATDSGGLTASSTAAFSVNAVVATCPDNQFSAKYFNNKTVSGTAIDGGCIDRIAFDWGAGSPSGVNIDSFSARYEGSFTFEAGTYSFVTLSDNAVRLWVDGILRIDQWVSHSPQTDVVEVEMTAGLHAIKLEYFENLSSAKINLAWYRKNLATNPLIQLRLDENTGNTIYNTGSVLGTLTKTNIPSWSTNRSSGGGYHSLDFGTANGQRYIESAVPITALGGLQKFTITGWLNVKSSIEGAGGNRIVTWLNGSGHGVDLVYRSDGSLQIGIDQYPDNVPARSNASKIPTSAAGDNSNWKFFAVTYDPALSTDDVKFYFGSQSETVSLDKAITYDRGDVGTSIARLAIGHFNVTTRSSSTADRMFKGLLDEIQIFGSALTLEEIQSIQGVTPTTSTCIDSFCAEYFNNNSLSGTPTYTATVAGSSFTNDWGGSGPGNGIGNDYFSARWTGTFNFDAGTYRFNTFSDDGIRVWVDNQLVVDFWTLHGGTSMAGDKVMTAGTHTVRIEYFEETGGAIANYNHVKL